MLQEIAASGGFAPLLAMTCFFDGAGAPNRFSPGEGSGKPLNILD